MRELLKRKINLPLPVKLFVAAAILLFIGYCTMNQPEGLSSEAMRKLREKADNDPYLNNHPGENK